MITVICINKNNICKEVSNMKTCYYITKYYNITKYFMILWVQSSNSLNYWGFREHPILWTSAILFRTLGFNPYINKWEYLYQQTGKFLSFLSMLQSWSSSLIIQKLQSCSISITYHLINLFILPILFMYRKNFALHIKFPKVSFRYNFSYPYLSPT